VWPVTNPEPGAGSPSTQTWQRSEEMKFKKEFLQEVVWRDADNVKVMLDEITDTSRWSIHHWIVFEFEGKFYGVSYSVGATESQDESPFQCDPDEIYVSEVRPVEKTIIDYVVVKNDDHRERKLNRKEGRQWKIYKRISSPKLVNS
jgi:hypothetical protein